MSVAAPATGFIAETGDPAVSPKVRKAFNAMTRRVMNKRALQSRWKVAAPQLLARSREELDVLRNRYAAASRKLVFLLDRQAGHKLLGKGDRARLADMIFDIASEIYDGGDDELAALRRKYDSDPRDSDDFDERLAELALSRPLHLSGPAFPWDEPPRERLLPPAPLPLPDPRRNARSQAAELAGMECMQQLYAQVLPELLPNMEHSMDQRELRRALLEQCHNAPARGDLLSLLEAQFALGLSDPARLEQLGEEKIKRYCIVLEEQSYRIGANITDIERRLMMELACRFDGVLTPEVMERDLKAAIADLRADVERTESHLADFEKIQALKEYLKGLAKNPVRDWW